MIQAISTKGDSDTSALDDGEEAEVITMFRAEALFDGVRHLYFPEGYIYYPNLVVLTAAFEYLKTLVNDNCNCPDLE